MPDPAPLATGRYYRLALTCPECRAGLEVQVYLDTVHQSDLAGNATLRGKLSGKPVAHECRQLRLVAADGTPDPDGPGPDPGGVPGQLELAPDGAERPPDWAERAAGRRMSNPT